MAGGDGRYWSLDAPGLTEEQAKQLLDEVKEQQFGWFGSGIAVDPSAWLTLHLYRASAEMLYDGLMSSAETATPEHGLAGDIGAWLRLSADAE